MKFLRDEEQIKSAKELILKKRAILTESCGAGKTLISLLASRKLNLPTYIVCPASAISSWEKDAKLIKFENYKISSWNKIVDVYRSWKGGGVFIVDEAQRISTTLKNKDRSKAVYFFSKKNPYLFLLSATPSEHNPLEFYWPLKLCGVHNFSREAFRIKFCGAYFHPFIRTKYGARVLVDKKPTNINYLLRLFNKVNVKNFERSLKINKKFITTPSSGWESPKFEETALARRMTGEFKLKFFKNYIKKNDLFEKKALYFTWHRSITLELADFLNCPYIIGGMSEKQRQKSIKEGLTKERLVVSLGAGGVAINGLEQFCFCFFVELSWSPASDFQAYMRMVRDKKPKEITVCYVISQDEHNYSVNKAKAPYLKKIGAVK